MFCVGHCPAKACLRYCDIWDCGVRDCGLANYQMGHCSIRDCPAQDFDSESIGDWGIQSVAFWSAVPETVCQTVEFDSGVRHYGADDLRMEWLMLKTVLLDNALNGNADVLVLGSQTTSLLLKSAGTLPLNVLKQYWEVQEFFLSNERSAGTRQHMPFKALVLEIGSPDCGVIQSDFDKCSIGHCSM